MDRCSEQQHRGEDIQVESCLGVIHNDMPHSGSSTVFVKRTFVKEVMT